MRSGQSDFVARYSPQWSEFAAMLDALDQRRPGSASFPQAYRRVCQQLALARDRGYGPDLVDRLHHLALRGHQQLYGVRRPSRAGIVQFLAAEFPGAVRRQWRLVLLAMLLLLIPAVGIGVITHVAPETVYTMMSPDQVREFEEMYRPDAAHLGREAGRESASDWLMFGFYIWNNIKVAFQCFATGLLLGLGPIFYLIYNGLLMGAVAGHLGNAGYTQTFYSFVIGHGAFELTAIVLSGAAGLKLGTALLFPGRLQRSVSLKLAARETLPILYGLTLMLIVAAMLEAFWSSSVSIPVSAKFAMGVVYWSLVLVYFTTRGRAHGD